MMTDFALGLARNVDDFCGDMSEPMGIDGASSCTALGIGNTAELRHIRALEQENERLRRLIIAVRLAA
jgi:hypothetical protein